jgi:hypothetical protein
MKIGLLLSTVAFSLFYGGKAVAVEPTAIDYNSNVSWSNPVSNEFDGAVVHDRHTVDDYKIVSSWSKKSIRFTLSRTFSKIEGYKAVETCKDGENNERRCEFKNEPVQKSYTQKYRASYFLISINNKLYKYAQGAVSPRLAKALVNAPNGKNAKIRISIADAVIESEIGAGTVQSWRKIFK